jgi:acyl-CoA reductase-like NAD-dependent aldehyde dehydrogenase
MSTERQFLFVGGEWIKPASSKRIEVINATTEEVIGSVPEGSAGDIDRAVWARRRSRLSTAEVHLSDGLERFITIAGVSR